MVFHHGFAQFNEDFKQTNQNQLNKEWQVFCGDGQAQATLEQQDDFARLHIDAHQDIYNIWWAVAKKEVTRQIDVYKLSQPAYELRIEARVRPSHAPRRINLHVHTQSTSDHHSHLREFDLDNNLTWHTVSMTTQAFEVQPEDQVFGQISLMDWGRGDFHLDIQYIKVSVVEPGSSGPDLGIPLEYWPPLADPQSFSHELPPSDDGMINLNFPNLNFNQWKAVNKPENVPVLNVNGEQWIILKWDLAEFNPGQVRGSGQFELSTYVLEKLEEPLNKEFGKIRICEILKGQTDWQEDDVTLNSLIMNYSLNEAINQQMIVDVPVNENHFGKTIITISEPVMQRLFQNQSLGLAIKPLGVVNASFYSHESTNPKLQPKLRFNLE